jgi:hypothetical protein
MEANARAGLLQAEMTSANIGAGVPQQSIEPNSKSGIFFPFIYEMQIFKIGEESAHVTCEVIY